MTDSMIKAARDKVLEQMKNNPAAGWSIDDLKTVAVRHGMDFRQGASRVVFLKKFVKLVEG